MKQNPTSTRTQIIVVVVLLGLGILVLIAVLLVAFRRNGLPLAVPTTQTPPIPTIIVPTVDCGSPTLLLGTSTFQIQNLTAAADGSFSVPADTSGIAYWLEGTDLQYIFMLSPTPENLSIVSTLAAGTTATATWSNCNSMRFTLSAPQPGTFGTTYLPEQSSASIAIFVQNGSSGDGLVVNGELTEERISTINTPALSDMLAEISLLETASSPDGASIRVGVSIQNYGALSITLSASDVSLLQDDSTAVMMASSEPALPREIAPGATETIYFNFQRPVSPTAILKIFGVEYDIEGY